MKFIKYMVALGGMCFGLSAMAAEQTFEVKGVKTENGAIKGTIVNTGEPARLMIKGDQTALLPTSPDPLGWSAEDPETGSYTTIEVLLNDKDVGCTFQIWKIEEGDYKVTVASGNDLNKCTNMSSEFLAFSTSLAQ